MQPVFIYYQLKSGSARYRIDAGCRGKINKQLVLILENAKHKVHLLYCMQDALHIIIRMNPDYSIEHLNQTIRKTSAMLINYVYKQRNRFFWSPGYIAESIHVSEIPERIQELRQCDTYIADDFNEPIINEP